MITQKQFEECLAEVETQQVSLYLVGNIEFNLYKIGVTRRSASARLRELEKGSPVPLSLLAEHRLRSRGHRMFQIENEIQAHYRDRRTRGEWFQNLDVQEFKRLATRHIRALGDAR